MFMRIECMVLGQLGMVQRRLQSASLMVPARFLVALVSMEQLFGCALVMLPDMLCIRIFNELIFMCISIPCSARSSHACHQTKPCSCM